MSTVLFSKTFIEIINTTIRRFWWAVVREDHHTSPIAFRSWDDMCKPPTEGGLGIRDMHLINRVLLSMLLGILLPTKTPSCQLFSKLNISLITLFGLLLLLDLGPSFGPRFCMSNNICTLMPFCIFILEIPPLGPSHGQTFGLLYMITLCFVF
jgi:hypothetical protein